MSKTLTRNNIKENRETGREGRGQKGIYLVICYLNRQTSNFVDSVICGLMSWYQVMTR